MRHFSILPIFCLVFLSSTGQSATKLPCSDSAYRQFDFWLGEWEAFGLNGQKAGDSEISLTLDSCVILEEWTSVPSAGVSAMPARVLTPGMPLPGNGNKPGSTMPAAVMNTCWEKPATTKSFIHLQLFR